MEPYIFKAEQTINASLKETFDFFSKAENLEKLTPPILRFEILTQLPIQIVQGTIIDYKIKLRGVPIKWKTVIEVWEPQVKFVDNQLKGPFKLWHHTHEFKSLGENKTLMKDTVRYLLPFGILGQLVHPLLVKPDVEKIFAYRNTVIEETFH